VGKEANLLGRRIEGAGAANEAQQTYADRQLRTPSITYAPPVSASK
jgi:hypothetical protein